MTKSTLGDKYWATAVDYDVPTLTATPISEQIADIRKNMAALLNEQQFRIGISDAVESHYAALKSLGAAPRVLLKAQAMHQRHQAMELSFMEGRIRDLLGMKK